MATLTLRNVKGTPLTNTEIDDNFTNLNTDVGNRLLSSAYTASDVLTKIKTVDGTGSGLDADLLDGLNAVSGATGASVVARDSSGNFAANVITASLTGNVTGNLTGNVTGNLTGNVTGDVTGDITGDVTGDVTGNLTGNVTGDVTGNLTGNVTGNTSGAHNGQVGNSVQASGAFTSLSASGNLSILGDASFSGKISANGSSGTSGYFLKSQGSSSPAIWSTVPINLESIDVSGTLDYLHGGTGLTSPGNIGNVLRSVGTAWESQELIVTAVELSGTQIGDAPIFAARVFANFDGTKDTSNTISTSNTNRKIRSSGNVDHILRNSTGNYTITFTTALPTNPAECCVNITAFDSSSGAISRSIYIDTSSTNSITINCKNTSDVQTDFNNINVTIIG